MAAGRSPRPWRCRRALLALRLPGLPCALQLRLLISAGTAGKLIPLLIDEILRRAYNADALSAVTASECRFHNLFLEKRSGFRKERAPES
jgi:hypothetical protein